MKAKLICDGCDEELKEVIDCGDTVFIINDNIWGLSVMENNKLRNKVVFCDECYEKLREELKDGESWLDLDMLDSTPGMVEDFIDYNELVKRIKEINKEEEK